MNSSWFLYQVYWFRSSNMTKWTCCFRLCVIANLLKVYKFESPVCLDYFLLRAMTLPPFYSSVTIVTRLRFGRSGAPFPQRKGFFFLFEKSKPSVGPTQLSGRKFSRLLATCAWTGRLLPCTMSRPALGSTRLSLNRVRKTCEAARLRLWMPGTYNPSSTTAVPAPLVPTFGSSYSVIAKRGLCYQSECVQFLFRFFPVRGQYWFKLICLLRVLSVISTALERFNAWIWFGTCLL